MAGGDVLPCRCGKPDCPAPTGDDARGRLFDILVLTDDPDAGGGIDEHDPPTPDLDAAGPEDDGPSPRDDPDYDWEQHWYDDEPDDGPEPPPDDPHESASTATEPAPAPCSYTSIFAGGGIIPAALLADIRRMGASVRTIIRPEDLTTEPRYRPSEAAQRFVRARDMTCRFTGCTRPAECGDLDHTVPHASGGLTHPGNLKTLCRQHYLLKTFWVGEGGWSDQQLQDGTIVWTSPSGLKHPCPDANCPCPNADAPALNNAPPPSKPNAHATATPR
jgi:hypothetical protein